MTYQRKEVIGAATLYLGSCEDVLPGLIGIDHIICDPPHSDRTHSNHDDASHRREGRSELSYAALTPADVEALAGAFHQTGAGWIVWLTDFELANHARRTLGALGRTTFVPLPYYHPGRSIRMAGDGPSSWTDLIVVARTKEHLRWGTLPGGYVAGAGWDDKARMGGKPTRLMQMLVADYSRSGELVCDPFMGAGTTGVACVKEGRRFIGIEIDEAAFDLSCRRIEDAQRQGQLFGDVA